MKVSLLHLNNIFHSFLVTYYSELEQTVANAKSLLDVGCGANSPIKHFKKKVNYSVGIDGFEPSITESRSKGIHNKYHCMDLLDIDKVFKKGEFDCVLASDVIEHLPKGKGFELIKQMESISNDKIIIFTPNGFLPQAEHSNNIMQKHLSGWCVNEMRELGYDVIGINGWKPLLGELSIPKFRPHKLWAIISRLSQPFVRNNPEYAFQILCVKKIKNH